MTAQVFCLPDLGEGLTEAQVLRWLIAEGDTVEVDQAIVEVETAKAAVEIPCPYGGTVATLHAEAGDVVDVGRPLITVSAGQPRLQEPGVVTAGDADDGSGNVLVGYGTAPEGRRRRRRAAPAAMATALITPDAPAPHRPRVISPVVRRLARERGVDLSAVAGSGRDGLILRRDVETASTSAVPAETAATPPAPLAGNRVALVGARRTAARRLATSRREIPEATVWVDADATKLMSARRALNVDPSRPQVSLLALVARFTVAALQMHPELNASYDAPTDELVLHPTVNLGIAAQTPNGLVVPVVRDAQSLTTRELSTALRSLVVRARDGQLTTADLTGGTCTLNNYGVFGVDGSAAIINHPEAAIVGIGRILQRPWMVEGAVVGRDITELTLAFDHRVCDGGVAASFLGFIRDCVEGPTTLLGEV